MITKNDLIIIFSQQNTEDAYKNAASVMNGSLSIVDAVKMLNKSRCLDVYDFYSKLKSSYNNKKSKLYINIMKSDENLLSDANTVVTTLSALLNQILQFKAKNKTMFLKHARAEEILKALHTYCIDYDSSDCLELLRYYKSDIKVMLGKNE